MHKVVDIIAFVDEVLNHVLQRHVKSSPPSAAYMSRSTGSALVHVMACHLLSAKPLPEPMLTYCQLDP